MIQETKTMRPRFSLNRMVKVAVFIALDVLLMNYLGIHTAKVKIGFSFVPIALCAMMYGPVWGSACAGLGDLINCFLSPFGWYPPLTLTAMLQGLVYGIFLKDKSDSLPAISLAVICYQLVVSMGINTWIIAGMRGITYWQCASTRIIQVLIMIPVQIIVLKLIGSKKLVQQLQSM